LQEGEALAAAPCLVVGAGTGLGMAIVLPQGGQWQVIAGEGGHVAFAPADEQQMALWAFLQARHGRVTWERVVSGPGLVAIHEFVAGVDLRPEEIATRALADPNSAEHRSLDLFLAAYGAFAGDMALACLARGRSAPRPSTRPSPRACRSTSPPIHCWDCTARCASRI
jgi:glucokinase